MELLQAGQVGSTWWVWVLIILLLVALVVWFMSLRRNDDERGRSLSPQLQDDLTKIEGIGPKIAGLMKESGVATFAVMAATSVERLQEILEGADFRALPNPSYLAGSGRAWLPRATGKLCRNCRMNWMAAAAHKKLHGWRFELNKKISRRFKSARDFGFGINSFASR